MGNRDVGRDYYDNRVHNRVDNRGGYYAGRDLNYSYREGDSYDVQGQTDPFDAIASGRGIGRLLTALGVIISLAGFCAFLWPVVIFIAGVSDSAQTGATPVAPMAVRLAGLPLIPMGIGAALVGGILASIGAAMAKAARRRHEQRLRARRRGY